MIINILTELLLVLFAQLPLPEVVAHRSQSTSNNLPTVSICALVREPDLYDRKLIRLDAIYAVNFEWVVLYDPRCTGNKHFLYPEIEESGDPRGEKMEDRIAKALKRGAAGED